MRSLTGRSASNGQQSTATGRSSPHDCSKLERGDIGGTEVASHTYVHHAHAPTLHIHMSHIRALGRCSGYSGTSTAPAVRLPPKTDTRSQVPIDQ